MTRKDTRRNRKKLPKLSLEDFNKAVEHSRKLLDGCHYLIFNAIHKDVCKYIPITMPKMREILNKLGYYGRGLQNIGLRRHTIYSLKHVDMDDILDDVVDKMKPEFLKPPDTWKSAARWDGSKYNRD